ncbi:Fic family protein [Corynebacterium breve]|uniref:protein adenylyltransferase n=1 Tax=Corynebacterium breve TaxID=3049799 RepID=A0ABY8VGY0_9CORY|nr:Fic family protein [Corynebacterium breve]WIM67474.1 Fic family protein [Corynebacterium breve]
MHDPYLIPGTTVLKNLLGIESSARLAEAEADLVHARIIQLMDSGDDLLPASRDAREIGAIHFHLFQDVYPWAGKFRNIDMKRDEGEHFAPYRKIDLFLRNLAQQLSDKNNLRIAVRSEFISELTHFYDLLNWIHPFREGNGRTQRHFWSRVSADAGWILDWRQVRGELNEASRRAREDQELEMLHRVFEQVVAKHRL